MFSAAPSAPVFEQVVWLSSTSLTTLQDEILAKAFDIGSNVRTKRDDEWQLEAHDSDKVKFTRSCVSHHEGGAAQHLARYHDRCTGVVCGGSLAELPQETCGKAP